MPLKLNVGLSKKMGLPRYGSLGAACHVEVELDSSLLSQDAERFQEHVRRAYIACAQAVNDELSRHRGEDVEQAREANCQNGKALSGRNCTVRQATQRQLAYAGQLAAEIAGLGAQELETLVGKMFDKAVADLTTFEASKLIETLTAIKMGHPPTALHAAAT